MGLPPRVRGGPCRTGDRGERRRITPACAGRTTRYSTSRPSCSDYPRVCGADLSWIALPSAKMDNPRVYRADCRPVCIFGLVLDDAHCVEVQERQRVPDPGEHRQGRALQPFTRRLLPRDAHAEVLADAMLSRPQPWDLPRPIPVMIAVDSVPGSVTTATPSNWVSGVADSLLRVVAADSIAWRAGDEGLQVQAAAGGAVEPPLLGVGAAQRDDLLAAGLAQAGVGGETVADEPCRGEPAQQRAPGRVTWAVP